MPLENWLHSLEERQKQENPQVLPRLIPVITSELLISVALGSTVIIARIFFIVVLGVQVPLL